MVRVNRKLILSVVIIIFILLATTLYYVMQYRNANSELLELKKLHYNYTASQLDRTVIEIEQLIIHPSTIAFTKVYDQLTLSSQLLSYFLYFDTSHKEEWRTLHATLSVTTREQLSKMYVEYGKIKELTSGNTQVLYDTSELLRLLLVTLENADNGTSIRKKDIEQVIRTRDTFLNKIEQMK